MNKNWSFILLKVSDILNDKKRRPDFDKKFERRLDTLSHLQWYPPPVAGPLQLLQLGIEVLCVVELTTAI